jgi:hypothetical protein
MGASLFCVGARLPQALDRESWAMTSRDILGCEQRRRLGLAGMAGAGALGLPGGVDNGPEGRPFLSDARSASDYESNWITKRLRGISMGIRVNGPQVVSFLEWMTRNADQETSLRDIGKSSMLTYAHQFRCSLKITERQYDFTDHDVLRAIEYAPPRPWSPLVRERPRLFQGDLLERYREIPWHALLLYTSQDGDLRTYLAEHWQAWSDESGDLLDFYDYSIRVNSPKAYSFTQDFLSTLSPIPGANSAEISAIGLPCMLLWSKNDHFLIPFSDVARDAYSIRERFRVVLQCLSQNRLEELEYRFQPTVADAAGDVADVFLSYKHDDRDIVEPLHDQLERDGFSVWFDRHLKAGERFDLRIRHFLAAAKATIVVWSANGIRSPWVLAEALFAHSGGRLVPITRRNGLSVPPPFNAVHALDFSKWPDDEPSEPYADLLKRLDELSESRRGQHHRIL